MYFVKICLFCQKEFSVPNYRKESALYCSRSCLAKQARQVVKSNCLICNSYFEHISSRCNKAKYCSRKCFYQSLKNKGNIEYTCRHCSKVFLGFKSQKRIYCSRACINKCKKETFIGKYTTIRKVMLARGMIDTCERCGFNEYPKILGVHHKDRNRKNNKLENLEVLCPNCHSKEHNKHICH